MRKFLLLVCILFFSNLLVAQTYEFLRVDMSPASAALGGSFAANNDDADVIFHNPAGISQLEKTPVSFSYLKHLMDINFASISVSSEFEGIGRLGAAIKYANYGTFTEADEYGNKGGEYGAGDLAFIVGYASQLDDQLYYGVNLKFIHSSLQDYSSSAVAADFGIHYVIPSQMINIGLSVLNLGTQLSSYIDTDENLPLDLTIGISKKLEHLPLKLYLDLHRINNSDGDFADRFKAFTVGGEFTLSNALKLRIGFDNQKRSDLKVSNFAGLAGFNVGFGLKISDYIFDYAFSSLGEVGAFHRIGIKTSFE